MNKEVHPGKRLATIAKLVIRCDEYQQIWDCCCDHGYLGAFLLNHYACQKKQRVQVNFVDQVSHITEVLQTRLQQSTLSNYQVYTLSAEELKFSQESHHCIIIAGVTTTGMLKILKAILDKHPNQQLDFILCPTRGQYDLRQFLINRKFHLIAEKHLIENNRHYEVLHVRCNTAIQQAGYQPIASIGEFWQTDNDEHLSYLHSKIHHYQQETLGKDKCYAEKALLSYTHEFLNTTK